MSFTRTWKTALVAMVSAVALGGGVSVAQAGVDPSPSPAITPEFTPPPPVVRTCDVRPVTFAPTVSPTDAVRLTAKVDRTPPPVINPQRCRPETFVAQFTALGGTVVQNRVIATGPVSGSGSLDLPAQTNTFDRFNLPAFFRSVNVPHSGLAFPSVDLRLCTASVVQVGLWRFAGGVGLFRFAIGNGTYQLVGQWVFPRIRGFCSLLFLRNPLLQTRVQPTYTNIQVWGTGLARR